MPIENRVEAALAAGMKVVVVTTEFTLPKFRQTHLLDRSWIVDASTSTAVVCRLTTNQDRQTGVSHLAPIAGYSPECVE
jgi:beta-phosphoglucomutase-like phosphatase (HAD superfamily)